MPRMGKQVLRASGVCWAAYLLAASVVVTGGGCTTLNQPLNSLTLPLEQRVKNSTRAALGAELLPQDSRDMQQIQPATRPDKPVATAPAAWQDADGYFVGLAISGGGSRSANFAAAAMFELQRLGMLQRVDYISSVSGGSLTAAYYCTQGEDWNPENVQKKLTHSFATDVIIQTFLPWNSLALMFTPVDRTDLLSDTFQQHLFSRNGKTLTYADLRPDRPRLLINATDLQSGKRFIFSNESFDEINSDLSQFPIARAVAASSSVPVLLHQLTLKDYSTTFNQYRHLLDGGVADNLGAKTLIETFAAQVEQARINGQPDPYPHGAVLLFLDATVEFDASLSDQEDISFINSLVAGAGLSTTSLINRAGSATLAEMIVQNAPDDASAKELRDYIATLRSTGCLSLKGRSGHPVQVMHIALSSMDSLSDVPFASFRERVNNIATYFNINRTEAFHLYQAADLIMKQKFEPRIEKLLEQMNGRASATQPAADRSNQ
jgi:predicted acylesterase/phospholipase RssA